MVFVLEISRNGKFRKAGQDIPASRNFSVVAKFRAVLCAISASLSFRGCGPFPPSAVPGRFPSPLRSDAPDGAYFKPAPGGERGRGSPKRRAVISSAIT